ncbi:hypothetical protein O7627_27650 [Solwaraspora sp. WMMD1047]|uniref:hypothetical protein n=1 Tax=Solwaraspora sp. WMMD1047 TaxID=3016102 RepID=UPI0024159D18|nr:hypothetical protein [Solwaraspora sp. WMMD1047]MDG4833053.1 hypothetical protein [Solwaraspora sp. WMMD1047]
MERSPEPERARRGSDRQHQFPGRQQRINLRLDHDEHQSVVQAAARAGRTPAGFSADAALAAARGTTAPGAPIAGITRTELAELQRELFAARTALVRIGTNLNQAVATLNATGEAPVWLGHAVTRCDRTRAHLDTLIADIHRRLR